jgi:thiol-disulfide isomerase/thioredoxin
MRGSWVVLHFTATWCPFCDSEIAHLGELAEAYAGRGVRTVVVDVEEGVGVWRAYARTHVAPALVALHDASGKASARFAPPRAQPSFGDRAQAVLDGTLIIDPEGKIRLFLLPDSAHFDPRFSGVRSELERLVPAPVVTVHAAAPAVPAGGRTHVDVTLRVADGFHVMSDRPSEPSYIPTTVALDVAEGMTIGTPLYPPPAPLALGERTLATFAGSVVVHVPLEVESGSAPGAHTLRGTVRYQACTAARCLFPASLPFAVTLDVMPR